MSSFPGIARIQTYYKEAHHTPAPLQSALSHSHGFLLITACVVILRPRFYQPLRVHCIHFITQTPIEESHSDLYFPNSFKQCCNAQYQTYVLAQLFP